MADNSFENGGRRIWTNDETLAFLECYAARRNDYQNRRKTYAIILKELMSRNMLTQETTVQMLEGKMKSLLRAFKSNSGNHSPAVFKKVEELFGSRKSIIARSNSKLKIQRLDESYIKNSPDMYYFENTDQNYTSKSYESSEDSFDMNTINQQSEIIKTEFDPISSQLNETSDESSNEKTKPYKNNKSFREIFYKEKIKMTKEIVATLNTMEANKQKRFQQAEIAKERRHKEKMYLLRSFLENQ